MKRERRRCREARCLIDHAKGMAPLQGEDPLLSAKPASRGPAAPSHGVRRSRPAESRCETVTAWQRRGIMILASSRRPRHRPLCQGRAGHDWCTARPGLTQRLTEPGRTVRHGVTRRSRRTVTRPDGTRPSPTRSPGIVIRA